MLGLLLPALGLAIFLEGLPYFVSPPTVRRYLQQMQQMSDGSMRTIGFVLMAVGLAVAYVSTR